MVPFNRENGMARDVYEFEYFTSLRKAAIYMFKQFVEMCNKGKLFDTRNCVDVERKGSNFFFEEFNVYVPISCTNVLTSSSFISTGKNTSPRKTMYTFSDIIKNIVLAENDIIEEFSAMLNTIYRICEIAGNVVDGRVDTSANKPFRDIYTEVVFSNYWNEEGNVTENLDGNRIFKFGAYNDLFEVDCNTYACKYYRDFSKNPCIGVQDEYYEDYKKLERFKYQMEYIAKNLWVELMEYDSMNCICKVGIGVRNRENK